MIVRPLRVVANVKNTPGMTERIALATAFDRILEAEAETQGQTYVTGSTFANATAVEANKYLWVIETEIMAIGTQEEYLPVLGCYGSRGIGVEKS